MEEIIFGGQELVLSPLRALFWRNEQSLVIADMHLGKTAYFRNKGIPIPSDVMAADLERLSLLIEKFSPQQIIVVGDMFHHDFNADIHCFSEWRKTYQDISFLLVPGNHDKLLDIDYVRLNILLTVKEYNRPPLLFVHENAKSGQQPFTISGHLHPGFLLQGNARRSLRLPCFITSPHHIVLPAFSLFTGLFTGYPKNGDHNYYVIGGDKIFCV